MADKGLLSLFSVGSMEEVHRSVAAKGEADLEALAAVLRLAPPLSKRREAPKAGPVREQVRATGRSAHKEGDEEDVALNPRSFRMIRVIASASRTTERALLLLLRARP